MNEEGKESQKEPIRQEELYEEEVNLIDYLRVIYKYRLMILTICIVSVAAAVVVSLFLPKIYSATASVVPPISILQKESDLAGGLGGPESSMLRKFVGATGIADMYAGILKSRVVADAIIDRFDLMHVYRGKKNRSDVRRKLEANTKIRVSDEGIVSVTVEDRDPKRAAAMANAYIEELDRQNKRLSRGEATYKRIFLEDRLEQIERELSRVEDMPSWQVKIKEMLFELLSREYELAKIEEAKSMPTIQVLDKAVVPEKKCKPKRALMAVLAGVTALFFSTFAAFVRECLAKEKTRPAAGDCA